MGEAESNQKVGVDQLDQLYDSVFRANEMLNWSAVQDAARGAADQLMADTVTVEGMRSFAKSRDLLKDLPWRPITGSVPGASPKADPQQGWPRAVPTSETLSCRRADGFVRIIYGDSPGVVHRLRAPAAQRMLDANPDAVLLSEDFERNLRKSHRASRGSCGGEVWYRALRAHSRIVGRRPGASDAGKKAAALNVVWEKFVGAPVKNFDLKIQGGEPIVGKWTFGVSGDEYDGLQKRLRAAESTTDGYVTPAEADAMLDAKIMDASGARVDGELEVAFPSCALGYDSGDPLPGVVFRGAPEPEDS